MNYKEKYYKYKEKYKKTLQKGGKSKVVKYMNGPIYVVQLKGKIGKIDKTITIIGEYHVMESQCEDDMSLNPDQYLVRVFSNCTEKLDFFLEHNPNNCNKNINPSYYDNKCHLNNLKMIFNKYYNKKNSKYPNIRFHYFDMRTTFQLLSKYNLQDFTLYRDITDAIMIQNRLNKFLDNFESNIYLNKHFVKLLDKERTKYKDVNDLMQYLVFKEYKNGLKEFSLYHKKLIDIHNKVQTLRQKYKYNINKPPSYSLGIPSEIFLRYQNEFKLIKQKIHSHVNEAFVTDGFLLKRFLDKDYIKKTVVYCGVGHLFHLVHILIKRMNFDIVQTSTNINKKEAKSKIKKGGITDVHKFLETNVFNQCIDMSQFKLCHN